MTSGFTNPRHALAFLRILSRQGDADGTRILTRFRELYGRGDLTVGAALSMAEAEVLQPKEGT